MNDRQAEIITEFLEKTTTIIYSEAPEVVREALLYIGTAAIGEFLFFTALGYAFYRAARHCWQWAKAEKAKSGIGDEELGLIGAVMMTIVGALAIYGAGTAVHSFVMVFLAPRYMLLEKLASLGN